jgi:hypothetical protein
MASGVVAFSLPKERAANQSSEWLAFPYTMQTFSGWWTGHRFDFQPSMPRPA